MTQINPIGGAGVGALSVPQTTASPAAAATAASVAVTAAPAYLALSFGDTLGALGIDPPRNADDTGALFAQITLELDKLFAAASSAKAVGLAGKVQNALAVLKGYLDAIAGLSAEIDRATTTRTKDQTDLVSARKQRDAAVSEKTNAQTALSTATGAKATIDDLDDALTKKDSARIDKNIDTLSKLPDYKTLAANLKAHLSDADKVKQDLADLKKTAADAAASARTRIDTATKTIDALDTRIDALTKNIDAQTKTIDSDTAQIAALQVLSQQVRLSIAANAATQSEQDKIADRQPASIVSNTLDAIDAQSRVLPDAAAAREKIRFADRAAAEAIRLLQATLARRGIDVGGAAGTAPVDQSNSAVRNVDAARVDGPPRGPESPVVAPAVIRSVDDLYRLYLQDQSTDTERSDRIPHALGTLLAQIAEVAQVLLEQIAEPPIAPAPPPGPGADDRLRLVG